MGYLARTSLPTAILLICALPSHGNDLAFHKLSCFGACEHYFLLPSQKSLKEAKVIRNKYENNKSSQTAADISPALTAIGFCRVKEWIKSVSKNPKFLQFSLGVVIILWDTWNKKMAPEEPICRYWLANASCSTELGSGKVSVSLGFQSFLLQGQLLAQCNTLLGYEGLEKLSTALLADWAENETLYFQIQHITHLLPKLSDKNLYSFDWQKKYSNIVFEGC